MNLILASSSPRRQELLKQVHIPFTIRKPDVDESQITITDPAEKVKQLALRKGRQVPIQNNNEVILAADTIVAFENNIFEKPKSKLDAYQMLQKLSGNTHEVYTGVMLRSTNKELLFTECTTVHFWTLTDEEIDAYLATNDAYDKAGGYGIQSVGAMFVKGINGDYYNVVGLPLSTVVRQLRDFGISH
ncbi:Maf family protein [Gracilibacillus sp. S3-1-1]|uniref:Maf family protein n=1 Tax=Gracilibacillus pellucidus TaxID=3095368 RepID=A0ACC6M0E9_9BACI|nr:Maf family protein [Gracilibacillus sp. S3-1-1]MDX8044422.1 Maf family protein [Gracilibacillus sp. S3-1-1]